MRVTRRCSPHARGRVVVAQVHGRRHVHRGDLGASFEGVEVCSSSSIPLRVMSLVDGGVGCSAKGGGVVGGGHGTSACGLCRVNRSCQARRRRCDSFPQQPVPRFQILWVTRTQTCRHICCPADVANFCQ